MKISPILNNPIAYKSTNEDKKTSPQSQPEQTAQTKHNYRNTIIAGTGIILLAAGIYKRKSINNFIKKIFNSSEKVHPEPKPENVKPSEVIPAEGKASETIPEEAVETLTPDSIYIPPKKPAAEQTRKKPTQIVIDEKGNILSRNSNPQSNTSRNSNPFNSGTTRGRTTNFSNTNRNQRRNDANRRDDYFTDYIILDDYPNNNQIGRRSSVDNFSERYKTDHPSESSIWDNISDRLHDIEDTIDDYADNFCDDFFDDFC